MRLPSKSLDRRLLRSCAALALALCFSPLARANIGRERADVFVGGIPAAAGMTALQVKRLGLPVGPPAVVNLAGPPKKINAPEVAKCMAVMLLLVLPAPYMVAHTIGTNIITISAERMGPGPGADAQLSICVGGLPIHTPVPAPIPQPPPGTVAHQFSIAGSMGVIVNGNVWSASVTNQNTKF